MKPIMDGIANEVLWYWEIFSCDSNKLRLSIVKIEKLYMMNYIRKDWVI